MNSLDGWGINILWTAQAWMCASMRKVHSSSSPMKYSSFDHFITSHNTFQTSEHLGVHICLWHDSHLFILSVISSSMIFINSLLCTVGNHISCIFMKACSDYVTFSIWKYSTLQTVLFSTGPLQALLCYLLYQKFYCCHLHSSSIYPSDILWNFDLKTIHAFP